MHSQCHNLGVRVSFTMYSNIRTTYVKKLVELQLRELTFHVLDTIYSMCIVLYLKRLFKVLFLQFKALCSVA